MRLSVVPLVMLGLMAQVSLVQGFEVESLEGDRIEHDQHARGPSWTLVFLWSLDGVTCEEQKPEISQFAGQSVVSGIQVLGVALDGVNHRDEFQARVAASNPGYPNYIALANVFERQFEQKTGELHRGVTPSYLLYRPMGALAGVHTGKIELSELRRFVQSSTPP